ncbi:MAG TPA: phage major capsid protein [Terrimesophilobacter sp.]|nr:phage major capsid protein [Terrimesophilobacter sp.]HRP99470.1 phage major capsid protein [Terrimesophilobacter sp.]
MKSIKEQHSEVFGELKTLTDRIKAQKRRPSQDERDRLEGLSIKMQELDDQLNQAKAFDELLEAVGRTPGDGEVLDGRGVLPFGRGAKALASSIEHRSNYTYGSKAFVNPGAVSVNVPLLPEIIEEGKPVPSLIDVIPAFTRSTPIYKYLRQTIRTLQAGPPHSETGVKPTSIVTVDDVDGALKVIATVSEPIDKYLLGDNSTLQQFLTSQLRYAVQVALEDQIVNGAGTGGTIEGIMTVSGTQSQSLVTDHFDTTRKAITKLEAKGYDAGVFAMSPDDWEEFELAVDLEGRYYLPGQGAPIDRAAQRIWGIPVTITNALDPGEALLWDRSALGLSHDGRLDTEWTNSHGEDFTKNLIRFRAEGRFNLDVFQPEAIVKIDLSSGS